MLIGSDLCQLQTSAAPVPNWIRNGTSAGAGLSGYGTGTGCEGEFPNVHPQRFRVQNTVQGTILREMSATDLTLKSSERLWEAKFLEGLAKTANVTLAAAEAGICRQTAYLWRKESQSFAERWDDAIEQAVDSLAQVAWERAMKGVEKPVYQQGRLVGSMREYSDSLTMFLLKAHRPDRYNVVRHTHEHSGPGRGPIPVAIENAIKQIFDAQPTAQLPAPIIDLVPAQILDSSCSAPAPEQCEQEREQD